MKRIRFKLFENDNLIWWEWLDNGDRELEFKPNCPQYIKDMWDQLNK